MPVSATGLRTKAARPSWCGRRRGGAMVELALTMGILVSLTFGMVEFGYYFYVKNSLEGAAREGARAGIVDSATNSDVTTAVNNAMSAAGIPTAKYSVSIKDTSGNNLTLSSTTADGTAVVVTVSGTWSVIGNGFRVMGYISGTKTVAGACVMRHE